MLLGISLVAFVLLRLTPGDPATLIAGPDASAESLESVRRSLGLDQPLPVQYFLWLTHIVQGDLGRSYTQGTPVFDILVAKVGHSLVLAVPSMVLATVVAVPAGIASAVRRGSLFDTLVMVLTMIGSCMAPFWTGLLLISLFAVTLPWLPTGGMFSLVDGGGAVDLLRHLVLPTTTLALLQMALIARMTRSSMLEVLHMDHLTTARSKGISERRVILHHAVKLAFLPVATVIGLRFGVVLGQGLIVETVFGWPGLGSQIYQAIAARDYAVVQGGVLFVAAAFVLINVVVDVAYVVIDPRIRYT